jgi:hypothetical protein
VRISLCQCSGCNCQTSGTAGTVFQDTRKPLSVWFRAMWFVISQKNGASALGLRPWTRPNNLRPYRQALQLAPHQITTCRDYLSQVHTQFAEYQV